MDFLAQNNSLGEQEAVLDVRLCSSTPCAGCGNLPFTDCMCHHNHFSSAPERELQTKMSILRSQNWLVAILPLRAIHTPPISTSLTCSFLYKMPPTAFMFAAAGNSETLADVRLLEQMLLSG